MDPVVVSFLTVIGSAVAAYSGAYFKKRGEDKAITDGFAEVLRQTRETTHATKGIEAHITNDLWDRQKRWELKRDVLFEMARKAALAIGAINRLKAVYTTEQINEQKGLPARPEKRLEVGGLWNDAAAEFEGMQILVAASCDKELIKSLGEFGVFMRDLSHEIVKVKPEAFDAAIVELGAKAGAISLAIRKELEIR